MEHPGVQAAAGSFAVPLTEARTGHEPHTEAAHRTGTQGVPAEKKTVQRRRVSGIF